MIINMNNSDVANDVKILRELARRTAEIAALPAQDEKRALWRKINALKPERPMVMIDQVCWHEMNMDDELTLRCKSGEAKDYELRLRKQLYQWRHFPVDMAVENFIRAPKAVGGFGFGPDVSEDLLVTDDKNDVLSHKYHNQINSIEDVEKIVPPTITHDEAETRRREEWANEVFGGILDVRMSGYDPYLSVWDPISTWMGVEGACFALADDPDMMHALVDKIVACYMSMLDQLEAQGLLCGTQSLIHCTGAWVDELPGATYDPARPFTKNIWMFGLAQMFSTVSPAMFEEFEVMPNLPIFERFGLVYYGCCDPLDLKMKEVRKIPNARKISMSPWASKARGAAEIGRDYVFSNKPNPAYLAPASFDEGLVRNDIRETVRICKENGCPLELILKDISTVHYEPQRLWRWAEIAMEEVMR